MAWGTVGRHEAGEADLNRIAPRRAADSVRVERASVLVSGTGDITTCVINCVATPCRRRDPALEASPHRTDALILLRAHFKQAMDELALRLASRHQLRESVLNRLFMRVAARLGDHMDAPLRRRGLNSTLWTSLVVVLRQRAALPLKPSGTERVHEFVADQ